MQPVILLLSLLMLGYSVQVQSQSNLLSVPVKKIKLLKSGDQIPDLVLRPLSTPPIRLLDSKVKLIILDFWGVNCSACLKAMPEMQALQEKFSGQVRIILVTKDDSAAVRKLFSRLPKLKGIQLPLVTNDTVLSKLFYYQSVPTHVWIDSDGKVVQKTSGYNTSASLIKRWLQGQRVVLPEKIEYEDYQNGVPLFLEGGGRQVNRMQYYSLIMKSPEGLDGLNDRLTERDSATGKVVRVLRSNVPLIDLYCYAFAEGDPANNFVYDAPRRLLLVDSVHIFDFPSQRDEISEWKKEYLVSYEIKVPVQKAGTIYKMMQEDLRRFFGYTASFQKRKIRCLVLKSLGKVPPSNHLTANPQWDPGVASLQAINIDMSFFSNRLKEIYAKKNIPLFDETKAAHKIDLQLNCGIQDWLELNKELSKYNLALIEEERILDTFVIEQVGKKLR